MDQLTMWGLNIRIILTVAVLFLLLLLLLAAIWTGIKIWLFHRRQRRGEWERRRDSLRPDGRPYPPAAEGVCDRCGGVPEAVYYLPTGRKLCLVCLEVEDPPRPGSGRTQSLGIN